MVWPNSTTPCDYCLNRHAVSSPGSRPAGHSACRNTDGRVDRLSEAGMLDLFLVHPENGCFHRPDLLLTIPMALGSTLYQPLDYRNSLVVYAFAGLGDNYSWNCIPQVHRGPAAILDLEQAKLADRIAWSIAYAFLELSYSSHKQSEIIFVYGQLPKRRSNLCRNGSLEPQRVHELPDIYEAFF